LLSQFFHDPKITFHDPKWCHDP